MHSSADIPKILADIIGNSADNSQYLADNPETPIPYYLERIKSTDFKISKPFPAQSVNKG